MSKEDKVELVRSIIKYREQVLSEFKGMSNGKGYAALVCEVEGMEVALSLYERGMDIDSRAKGFVKNRSKLHNKAFMMGMYLASKIIQ